MNTSILSPLAAGLLLLALNGMPAGRADGIPELRLMPATELKANASGHFITKASINGSDITVLVDTGATTVALSYEDAEDAGLRPGHLDFNVPVSTANGVTKAARVKIDHIAVDGVEVENVDGMVLPEGALKGTLLGMSFLSRLRSFRVEDGILYLKD
ncbi:MAG: TIGR02281 family clan AA aspartic protease [Rhizobiales bacterium]|nr:TIGR02281 family clan AA aspartic protease [Hyphomicrobiales bacterium]